MKNHKDGGGAGYTQVTEKPGDPAHNEQLSAIVTRYTLAAAHARGGHILEVACGAGIGLGLMAETAASVTAGDIDPDNLQFAIESYRGVKNVRIQSLDACDLRFPDASFDVVVIYEAIYYLPNLATFFNGVRRVLRPGGKLLIWTVNPEWHGFDRSIRSTRYYALNELSGLLAAHHFEVEFFAMFQDAPSSLLRRISQPLRQLAIAAHLIPKTMKGKALLKRLFYGKLAPVPRTIKMTDAVYVAPKPVRVGEQVDNFKFIYAVAVMR